MKKDDIIRKEVEEARVLQASLCNGWEREQWFIDFNQEKKPHS